MFFNRNIPNITATGRKKVLMAHRLNYITVIKLEEFVAVELTFEPYVMHL